MKRPYVIAVDAVSGGGKTTLSQAVDKSLSSSALYCFDDFEETNVYPEDFYEWWRRGADVSEFDCPGMYKAVSEKIEKNDVDCVILDYPFGRQHERFRDLIDLSVFIDTPLDIAMGRRILRDECNNLEDLKSEVVSYESYGRPLYLDDAAKGKEDCDLLLDGTKSIEALTKLLLEEINKRSS
jgi:uridine kinase